METDPRDGFENRYSYVALAASDAIVKGPSQGFILEVVAVEKLRQPRRA